MKAIFASPYLAYRHHRLEEAIVITCQPLSVHPTTIYFSQFYNATLVHNHQISHIFRLFSHLIVPLSLFLDQLGEGCKGIQEGIFLMNNFFKYFEY